MSSNYIDYQTVDRGAIAIVSLARPSDDDTHNRGLIDELHHALRAPNSTTTSTL